MMLADRSSDDTGSATVATPTITSTTPEPEDADPKKNHQKKSGTRSRPAARSTADCA